MTEIANYRKSLSKLDSVAGDMEIAWVFNGRNQDSSLVLCHGSPARKRPHALVDCQEHEDIMTSDEEEAAILTSEEEVDVKTSSDQSDQEDTWQF